MEKQEFSNSHTFHSESEKVEIIKRAHVSSGTKVFLWQLMIFMLTYLSYAFLH